jgi:hypothetical protein
LLPSSIGTGAHCPALSSALGEAASSTPADQATVWPDHPQTTSMWPQSHGR